MKLSIEAAVHIFFILIAAMTLGEVVMIQRQLEQASAFYQEVIDTMEICGNEEAAIDLCQSESGKKGYVLTIQPEEAWRGHISYHVTMRYQIKAAFPLIGEILSREGTIEGYAR